MIGDILYASGAPCPTLVLDADTLPASDQEIIAALTRTRQWMAARGGDHILKIALIKQAQHPLFDLDYRFVQTMPADEDRFDLRGSCGHSILAAVLAAGRRGWLPPLEPGSRVRVRVVNNGDHVVCELDESDRNRATFTVHFLPDTAKPIRDLLLTGEPSEELRSGSRSLRVSFVSMGNPYVFVDAAELGIENERALFAQDHALLDLVTTVRWDAARRLGWAPDGAFPKIALVGTFADQTLSVRALSVPSWHPTFALTGVTCLTAATTISGTVPHRLAQAAHCTPGKVSISTPGGLTRASAAVVSGGSQDMLAWVSVSRKVVRHLTTVLVDPLRPYASKENEKCLNVAR